MAIIKCDECGNDVSDMADVCPKCGYPIGKITSKNVDNESRSESGPGFFDYVEASFSSRFAYGAGSLAGLYTVFAIPFAGLTVLDAAMLLVVAIVSGAFLHFLLFQLPVISLGQVLTGGPIRKAVGILGVMLFILIVYGGWNLFSDATTKNNMTSQSNSTKHKTTSQTITEIRNDTKTKVYLPKGVAGSSVPPTEEVMIKRQCGSCATNLSSESAVANNQSIISNCATIIQKCNNIGITW